MTIGAGDAADDDWNDFEGPASSNADGPRIQDDDVMSSDDALVEANTVKQLVDMNIMTTATGDVADDDWNDFEDCSKDLRNEATALDAPILESSSQQPLGLDPDSNLATPNKAHFRTASVADHCHLREPIANCALSQVIILYDRQTIDTPDYNVLQCSCLTRMRSLHCWTSAEF